MIGRRAVLRIDADGCVFEVAVDDWTLSECIGRVFLDGCATPARRREIRIEGTGPYYLREAGTWLARADSRASVVFELTRILGAEIRSHVTETRCTMHSSASVIGGGAVCLLGTSGSGKSTLSVKLASHGSFLGDEYGFLDLTSGMVSQASYPLQIKPGSVHLFESALFDGALELEGAEFSKSYLIPSSSVSRMVKLVAGEYPLRALVFPHFSESAPRAELCEVGATRLPGLALQSMRCGLDSAKLMQALLRLSATKGIGFYEAEFSDGEALAALMARRFSGKEAACR